MNMTTKPNTKEELIRWIRRGNGAGSDLRDADLYDANLTRANLTRANLSGANLSGADLREADLDDANLADADLAGANLAGADFTDANLTCANIAACIFQAGKHHAVFAGGWGAVGCERHTYQEWLDNGIQIGKKNGYTDAEIELYMQLIRIGVEWLRTVENADGSPKEGKEWKPA